MSNLHNNKINPPNLNPVTNINNTQTKINSTKGIHKKSKSITYEFVSL